LKSGLNIYDAELPVLDFAMRSHGPEKSDAMPGHRDARMIPAGHEHRVAVTNCGDKLRILGVKAGSGISK
jgi:hypothetical protein